MYTDPFDNLQTALDAVADDLKRDPRTPSRLVEAAWLRFCQHSSSVPPLRRLAIYAADLAAAQEAER